MFQIPIPFLGHMSETLTNEPPGGHQDRGQAQCGIYGASVAVEARQRVSQCGIAAVDPRSNRHGLRVIADRLVELLELERFVASLRHLPNHPSRPPRDNAEAWDNHVGRNHRAVEDACVVLDNGKFPNGNPLPDVYATADARSLDHCALSDENVLAYPERHVGESSVRKSKCKLIAQLIGG